MVFLIPLAMAAASAAASLGSAAMAKGASEADRRAAEEARQKAIQLWSQIDDPKYKELIAPVLQSSFDGVQADPRLKDAQMQALSQLQQEANGGWSMQDKAAMAAAEQEAANAERGQRGAIMQNFAARGQAGSGNELAAQLEAQQGGANRTSAFAMGQAGEAQRRALQAIQASGDLSYRMRGQDVSEQENKARSRDAINQLNAGYSQWAQQGNNQNIKNAADFQMNKVAGMTGQYNNNAGAADHYGQQDSAYINTMGQAAAQGFSSIGKQFIPKDKKDEETK